MTFRSNAGTHPIAEDVYGHLGTLKRLYPGICINCGSPLEFHSDFPCPNRLLTPKELGALRRSRKPSAENLADIDDLLRGTRL